jgi:hypothetical protein
MLPKVHRATTPTHATRLRIDGPAAVLEGTPSKLTARLWSSVLLACRNIARDQG